MASSNSAEIVNQMESGSIHSSDIREVAQDDKPTSELRSRKKRKIKVSRIMNAIIAYSTS